MATKPSAKNAVPSYLPPPPDGLLWYDGMLLTEQHFQKLEERQQQMLAYVTHSACPYFWGVRRCEYEEERVPLGEFVLRRLEATLPTGLAFSYFAESAPPLIINLEKEADRFRAGQLVYVYIRSGNSEHGPRDSEQLDEKSEIERLPPVLGMHLDPDSRKSGLPVARLRYEGNRKFKVDTTYIPATPLIWPGHPLHNMCSEYAIRLRRMAADAMAQAGRLNSDVGVRMKAYGLTAGLFALEAVLTTGISHPLQIYIAFCQVSGQLAAAAVVPGLPPFPAYDHRDIRASFQHPFDLITQALEVWPEEYETYPFQRDPDGFSIRLQTGWLPTVADPEWPRLVIEGRASPTADREALRSWLQNAIIAVHPKMEGARRARILGAQRKLNTDSLQAFVPEPGSVLLELSAKPNDEFLVSEDGPDARLLQVLNPDDLNGPPDSLTLYVRKKPQLARLGSDSMAGAQASQAPEPLAARCHEEVTAAAVAPQLGELYAEIGRLKIENDHLKRKAAGE